MDDLFISIKDFLRAQEEKSSAQEAKPPPPWAKRPPGMSHPWDAMLPDLTGLDMNDPDVVFRVTEMLPENIKTIIATVILVAAVSKEDDTTFFGAVDKSVALFGPVVTCTALAMTAWGVGHPQDVPPIIRRYAASLPTSKELHDRGLI